jgi:glucose-1-phosphate cytidylyltransferase
VKVVILCGGQGTRMREETEFKPKPLVDVGGRPILWHIMKHYSHYGHRDFVLALGYKGDMIKEYFLNYEAMNNNFTINLANRRLLTFHDNMRDDWNVTLVDTGIETNTGGRIKRVQSFIEDDDFFCTYGDGVSNLDLDALYKFHKGHGRVATLTGLHPVSKFGVFQHAEDHLVTGFKEKPRMDDLVSGGFFVFKRRIFDYLNDNSVLETEPLERLTQERQLAVHVHDGFWQSMDTYKDALVLNELWATGRSDWKVWSD